MKIHERVTEWANKSLEDSAPPPPVKLAAPGFREGEEGVNFYLLEILQVPSARGSARPPLRITFRYLVTAYASDPGRAHSWLRSLLIRALEISESPQTSEDNGEEEEPWAVEAEPLSMATWSALG